MKEILRSNYLKWGVRILAVIGVFLLLTNLGSWWTWYIDVGVEPPAQVVTLTSVGAIMIMPQMLYTMVVLAMKENADDETN